MSLDAYLIYLLALAAFFATPPDTSQLLVISNSVRYGVRRSMLTIGGDLSANVLQMTAAAFGLTAIIATSATALTVVKWLGVAYLVWIGLQLFFSKGVEISAQHSSAGNLFRQGFLTSLANPYAVVFFGALFPQFIDPSQPIIPQLLILGVTYLLVDGAILIAWGLAATKTVATFKALSLTHINRVCGLLMIAAAALLAGKNTLTGDTHE